MHIFSYKSISRLYPEKKITKTHIRVFTTFNILTIGKDNLTTGLKTISNYKNLFLILKIVQALHEHGEKSLTKQFLFQIKEGERCTQKQIT